MLLNYIKSDGSRSTMRVSAAQKEVLKFLCSESYNEEVSLTRYISDLYSEYELTDMKCNFSDYVRDIIYKEFLNLLNEFEEIS